MVVFYCVDDDGGLLFNKRRQSMDSELRKRILGFVGKISFSAIHTRRSSLKKRISFKS